MTYDLKNDKEYEYCLRCGRKLKNEKARKTGYGEVCFKKMQTQHKHSLFTLPTK